METPSAGPRGPSEGLPTVAPPPDPEDREVLVFLARELVPALGEHATRALRDAVRRALREQRLAPLERLSGRHRHELLLAIEQVSETRRRPSASILVRLTTVVSAIPRPRELVELSATRPAR